MTPSAALNLTDDAILDFFRNSEPLLNISEERQESLDQVHTHISGMKRNTTKHPPNHARLTLQIKLEDASPKTVEIATHLAEHLAHALAAQPEVKFKQWHISCIPMDSDSYKGYTFIDLTLTAPFAD